MWGAALLVVGVVRDGLGPDDVIHGEVGHGTAVIAVGAPLRSLKKRGQATFPKSSLTPFPRPGWKPRARAWGSDKNCMFAHAG